jgi:hypothetical protein
MRRVLLEDLLGIGAQMVDFETGISGVIFIQSLAEGRTGRAVHDHIRSMATAKGIYFEPAVRDVETREELLRELEDINRVTRRERIRPAIQLDAHGSVEGLALSDGSCMAWRELAEPLRRINEGCRNGLMLCSSMCNGGHLSLIALSQSVFRPTPYWGLIGPMKELSAGKLQSACQEFWEYVLVRSDAAKAIAKFDEIAGPAAFIQSEMLFGRVWMSYVLSMVNDPDGLDERVARIRSESNASVPDQHIRDCLCSLAALEREFRKRRDCFLWVDQFPELADRYNMTFADACGIYPDG